MGQSYSPSLCLLRALTDITGYRYLTGKGYSDIQEEIERLYQRHGKDFISPNGARVFRRKLEDDLRSVTAVSEPSSATGQTDSGYALNRFIEELGEAEAPVEAPMIEPS